MTQKEIIDALQKSLTQGSGSLDDLSNLLARVQVDIDKAKQEEVENKRKSEDARGQRIAEIATRMLQRQLTSEDVAFIFNEYFYDKSWTAKDIDELNEHMQNTSKVTKDLTDAIEEVLQNFANVFNTKDAPKVDNKQPKDPDDVLKKFLKDFGL